MKPRIVVGIDNKVAWDDSGNLINYGPGRDLICFLDTKDPEAPAVMHSLAFENSIYGPPVNLAIHPSGALALVANSVTPTRVGEAWGAPAPDRKVYVFDLSASPPQHIATVEAGRQPSGLAISKKGDLALVANRADHSITVLAISDRNVSRLDTIPMVDSVAHIAITPDGTRALAIKPDANKAALLKIKDRTVSYDNYDMPTGVYPYNVDITPNGKLALVANNGGGGNPDGHADTVAVIDMELTPPRVIDHVVVGDAPEGLAISPSGDFAVALLLRGSNADRKAFFYNRNSSVVGLKIDGKKVTRTGEIEVGRVAEGVAFSADGTYVYAANFLDSDLSVLKVEGSQLIDTGKRISLPGPPASMRSLP